MIVPVPKGPLVTVPLAGVLLVRIPTGAPELMVMPPLKVFAQLEEGLLLAVGSENRDDERVDVVRNDVADR